MGGTGDVPGYRTDSGPITSPIKEIPLNHTTPQNDVAVVVRLPIELREALKAAAAAEDRSVASLLRLAAREYLSKAVQT